MEKAKNELGKVVKSSKQQVLHYSFIGVNCSVRGVSAKPPAGGGAQSAPTTILFNRALPAA